MAASLTLLFGSSVNPPTGFGGHAGLVRWAAQAPEVEALWVLPVYHHAFKAKRTLAPYAHRLAMAKLAFERAYAMPSGISVLETEREVHEAFRAQAREDQPGSVDVIRALRRAHPGRRFGFLVGRDAERDLRAGRWKESEALLSMVELWVVAREGYERPGMPVPDPRSKKPPKLSAISSSQVRASRDPAFLRANLQPEVLDYIRAYGLYRFGEPDGGLRALDQDSSLAP